MRQHREKALDLTYTSAPGLAPQERVGALIERGSHSPLCASTQDVMNQTFELLSPVAEWRYKEPETI
jgi:hypothetical protein